MKTALFNVRRIVVLSALSALALLVFLLIRWTVFAQDEDAMNPDDLSHAQTDQPAGAGHRRMNATQATEILLSTQYQLKGIIAAASVEDSVVIIHDISTERRDQHLHLGEQLADGSILREVYASSVIIDRDGRLERIVLKENRSTNQSKAIEQQESRPEAAPATSTEPGERQALPRAGLSLKTTPPTRQSKPTDPGRGNSLRDQQVADSGKLPGYHREQRSQLIVPPAPDSRVLETPERIVPKAQGNRLPTASYIPPLS